MGIDVQIENELGAYDHLYDTSDVPGTGGKHYVAHGYVVNPHSTSFRLDTQHGDHRVFAPADLPPHHPYVMAYLADAGMTQ